MREILKDKVWDMKMNLSKRESNVSKCRENGKHEMCSRNSPCTAWLVYLKCEDKLQVRVDNHEEASVPSEGV